jgi:hypothetical protein
MSFLAFANLFRVYSAVDLALLSHVSCLMLLRYRYCGGLGHSIVNCPKLEREKMSSALGAGPTRDYTSDRSGMAAYGAEM